METIAVELLERIFLFTRAPKAVLYAQVVCKKWNNIIANDQRLWKDFYFSMVTTTPGNDSDDWKQKVVDLVNIRNNVQSGKCVMRALASTFGSNYRNVDNITVNNDYLLVNWMSVEFPGPFPGVHFSRTYSNLINLVSEEVTDINEKTILLINNFVANTKPDYYGGSTFDHVKVLPFDPKEMNSDWRFDQDNARGFLMPLKNRKLVKSYCKDSKYVAFFDDYGTQPTFVVDAESGVIAWQTPYSETSQRNIFKIHDKYLASFGRRLTDEKQVVEIIDITTDTRKRKKFEETAEVGFMTANSIIVRNKDQIVSWDFVDDIETIYPAGDMPVCPILMIYQDMWVAQHDSKINFYDVKDGSFLNSLSSRFSISADLAVLGDGRLAILNKAGCGVFSFFNSEVNRKIKVDIIDIEANVTAHEISAFELPELVTKETGEPPKQMASRVISYSAPLQSDERFVMIFAQTETGGIVNATATELLKTAVTPLNLNVPYQAWGFSADPIDFGNWGIVRDFQQIQVISEPGPLQEIFSKAIIVREKKIDGRFQLVSM